MELKRVILLCILLAVLLALPGLVLGAGPSVGKLVAVRGAATITRGGSQIKAQVNGGVLADDTIKTGPAGRAKVLFIDDSVLTLSENSTLSVKQFIYAPGSRGRSIYNLLDGKMRSVVGKSEFEVRTPTAVAAARGTVIYFDVGQTGNHGYSRILCLEGKVEVKNVLPSVRGFTTLTPGTMVVVKAGETPPPPVKAPAAEMEKARKATSAPSQAEKGTAADSSSASQGSGSASQGSGSTSQDSGTASQGSGTASQASGSVAQDSGAASQGSGSSSSGNGSASTVAQLSSLPAPELQEPSPAASQASGATLVAAPAVTSSTTSGVGVTPPVLPQPVRQPTRVNIGIGIPAVTHH